MLWLNNKRNRKEFELKYRNRSFLVLTLICSLTGCSLIKPHPVHPGTANKFDSDTYDALAFADSVIKGTEQELATSNNGFPPSILPQIRTALSYLIDSYNTARGVYLIYHNAAMNGTATTTQSDAVSKAIADVNAKTTALANAKVGK